MNLRQISLAMVLTGVSAAAATAQAPQEQPTGSKTAPASNESLRAEAYYPFTMGHISEQPYEATSNAEYATQSIEAHNRAYAPDPKSHVIRERRAAHHPNAHRITDAGA